MWRFNNNALDEIYLWAPRLRGPGACAPRAPWLIRYWSTHKKLLYGNPLSEICLDSLAEDSSSNPPSCEYPTFLVTSLPLL